MVIVSILIALSLLRMTAVAVGAAMLIKPVRSCPACYQATVAIRRLWLDRLARRYEWRWCPHCRWEGLARRRGAAIG